MSVGQSDRGGDERRVGAARVRGGAGRRSRSRQGAARPDSVAAQILRDLGAQPAAVREQLADMLGIEPAGLVARTQRRRLLRAVGRSWGSLLASRGGR